MNLSDWLGLAALVVAIIAIPIAIWTTRRWGTRRKRVLLTYESTPLISQLSGEARSEITVHYRRDFTVPDPHLLKIRLQNIGPSDIASSDFDSGHPISIRLNCKLYGITNTSHSGSTTSSAIGSNGTINLSPTLLKRQEAWEIESLTSGSGIPEADVPLINTDILDKKSYDAAIARSALVALLRVAAELTPTSGAIASAISAFPTTPRSPSGGG
jgi:hypothetical protein